MEQSTITAAVAPTSWRDSDNSVEATIATSTPVARANGYGERIMEVLEPAGADLTRLNAGASLLNSHRQDDLAAVIGAVVEGSARVEGDAIIARLRIDDEAVASRVKSGALKFLSIGYDIEDSRMEYSEGADGEERAVMRVTRWSPIEVSLVPVPADSNARTRARPRAVSEDRVIAAAVRAGLSDATRAALVRQHASTPFTETQLMDNVGQAWAARDEARTIQTGGRRVIRDEGDTTRAAIAGALLHRMAGGHIAADDPARKFAGQSAVDLMRATLEMRGERDVRHTTPAEIVKRALHVSGDFPAILANATGRHLLTVFKQFSSPLRPVFHDKLVRDFRAQRWVALDGPAELDFLPEGGEVKHSTMTETQEVGALATFARNFAITRQALINDDLGAFGQTANMMAQAAAATEASAMAALLLANTGDGPNLSDAVPLFATARGNKASSGSALNVANLGLARAAMRQQKARDGKTPIAAAPAFLLVGAALETTAQQILADLQPTQVSEQNPFARSMQLLVEPRITGNSWRLFADHSVFPVLNLLLLEGNPAPSVEEFVTEQFDGVTFRCIYDFGVAVSDWRGSYLNAGA